MRWLNQSVCIIASGPSLTADDAALARKYMHRVIVVNESWRMCPDADVLYGADESWWTHRRPTMDEFKGERWTQDKSWTRTKPEGVQTIRAEHGRNIAPPGADHVFTGSNSGYQALGLAVVWGAKCITFLGLDLQSAKDGMNHWHGDHPQPLTNQRTSYPNFRRAFTEAAPKLAALGVIVVNSSSETALEAFPRVPIQVAARAWRR